MTDHLPPSGAGALARLHPEIWAAYAALGEACAEAGTLDAPTRRLVKLALAAGRGSEGAVHSHARRAIEEGIAPDQVIQVALLAIPTLGLPGGAATLSWVLDVVGDGAGDTR